MLLKSEPALFLFKTQSVKNIQPGYNLKIYEAVWDILKFTLKNILDQFDNTHNGVTLKVRKRE